MRARTQLGVVPIASQAPRAPARVEPARPANRWLITLAVSFGTVMGAIDSSIVNVALPQMRGSLGATLEEITWVTTGYVMANVIVMPLTAFLGALFGQKRLYLASFALFLAGSLLCGAAHSLPTMVLFRLVQGAGAGALQPTTQAILRQTFPPKEQGMAMAIFTMGVMVGPALGPTLGGYIVDHYHWPWIFLINLPVGVIGFLLVLRFLHEPDDIREANRLRAAQQRKHLDWAGIALLSVGMMLLQYVLEEGQRNDWFESRTITACALGAALLLALLVIRELTAPVPVINLRLFWDPVFASGTVVGAVTFAMLTANMFLLPVFMQELLGFTAMQAGIALLPRVLAMTVLSPLVGRLYGRVPVRVMAAFGSLLFFAGSWRMHAFNLDTSSYDVGVALLLQGAGFSFLYVPLMTVAIAGIPRALLTDATGLNSLVRQIGGSMGLAIFATLITRFGVASRAAVGAHLVASRPEVQARLSALQRGLMARGLDASSANAASLRALAGAVAKQAAVLTFDQLFLVAGVALLFTLPLILLLREARSTEKREAAHADLDA